MGIRRIKKQLHKRRQRHWSNAEWLRCVYTMFYRSLGTTWHSKSTEKASAAASGWEVVNWTAVGSARWGQILALLTLRLCSGHLPLRASAFSQRCWEKQVWVHRNASSELGASQQTQNKCQCPHTRQASPYTAGRLVKNQHVTFLNLDTHLKYSSKMTTSGCCA